ncbi:uncharacterized protein PRCAT00002909001 [Priceomyces carsonii]|uniref:uncharacterized protein n=1 Tax=Priceomyces carsonii TaxID=28549 RepID=UPI002ED7C1A3|nr:unnamed protein product [Priceomyces carsonii]
MISGIFHLALIMMLSIASAATTTSATPTSVWVTGTDSNGITRTTLSEYYQSFLSYPTTAASVPEGSVGLGSISGTLASIRTYDMVTVSSTENGAQSLFHIGLGEHKTLETFTASLALFPLAIFFLVFFL